MDIKPDKESIFVTGLDPSITEQDLKDFFRTVVSHDPIIKLHFFAVLEKPKVLGEVILGIDDAILAHNKLNNTKFKSCYIKLIPKNSMRTLIINNLPSVISEKDLFLMLNKVTPNLRRIMIADDAEICGKTLNLAIAIYSTYEAANEAFEILTLNNKIMQNTIQVCWKEPGYDILAELAMETRTIYVKNISLNTNVDRLKSLLSKYGTIIRIKKYADKAFIEFDTIKSAKKVIEAFQDKRIDGMIWKIYPAKRFDEEKNKENPDKNLIFSKNFLEEADQHTLLKFAFDGTIPDIGPNYLQAAEEILESAKRMQRSTYENLKEQYDNIKKMQSFEAQEDASPIRAKKKPKKVKPQVNEVIQGYPQQTAYRPSPQPYMGPYGMPDNTGIPGNILLMPTPGPYPTNPMMNPQAMPTNLNPMGMLGNPMGGIPMMANQGQIPGNPMMTSNMAFYGQAQPFRQKF